MEFKAIEYSNEFIGKYWDGPTNRFARYFAYLRRFLSLINEAKYVLAAFGLGVFKSDLVIPSWVMICVGITVLPLAILIGRWHLFKVQKAEEFINTRHGTITGFQGFNMAVRQVELQEEILKQLEQLNRKGYN